MPRGEERSQNVEAAESRNRGAIEDREWHEAYTAPMREEAKHSRIDGARALLLRQHLRRFAYSRRFEQAQKQSAP